MVLDVILVTFGDLGDTLYDFRSLGSGSGNR
jgi:hypothetical protein